MSQVLNFTRDNFDQENTFAFAYVGARGIELVCTGYLFRSAENGQIFIMKQSACIKDTYTDADRAERRRLDAQIPLRTNDVVTVDGNNYRVRILGNYSDAGRKRLEWVKDGSDWKIRREAQQ